jgi:hypothetical protein
MPAFEAQAALEKSGTLILPVPVVNVAYGEADEAWAERYGVSKNLVFDRDGSAIVKPLGIGTFTTLVLDAEGNVMHVDRPDRAGFPSRVLAALRALPSIKAAAPRAGAVRGGEDLLVPTSAEFDRAAAMDALAPVDPLGSN